MATTQAQQPLPATAATTATAASADGDMPRRDSPAYTEEQRAALAAAVAQAEAGGGGGGEAAASTTGRASVETTYTTNTESPLLSGDGQGGEGERLRKYNMYYTTSRLSVLLHRGKRQDTPAEYYMQSDILTLKKPQLLLRRQTPDASDKDKDKDGPVVAWGKLKLFPWRHCAIGLGDPTTASESIKLHRDKNFIHRSDWRFSTDLGSPNDSKQVVEYVWRKDMAKYGATIYKCVQEGHEEKVYARLLSGGGLNAKKGGEIMVREGLESGLEALLLVSAQTIWAWEALDYQSLRQGYTSSNGKSDKSKSD